MNKREWAQSPHCRGGTHCGRCRDVVLGRGFREDKAEAYAVPGGEVDFPCPWGRPWGWAPPVPVPVDGYEAGADVPCCDPPRATDE